MSESRDLREEESCESEPEAVALETDSLKKNSGKRGLATPVPIMKESKRSKKKSETEAAAAVVAVDDSKKQLSETEEAAKISKEKSSETEEMAAVDEKKLLFQRLWSEEDEIVLLQGMIDYGTIEKTDPMSDLNAFHEYIKESIHIDDVSKAQLKDKLRRLKKKYENNLSKEDKKTKRGKNYKVTSSNPHEQMMYQLSKKVWGDDLIIASSPPKSIGGDSRIVDKLELNFEHANIILEKMREEMKERRNSKFRVKVKETVEKLELNFENTKILLEKMKKN